MAIKPHEILGGAVFAVVATVSIALFLFMLGVFAFFVAVIGAVFVAPFTG